MLSYKIKDYSEDSKTVEVTFMDEDLDIVYTRTVNAVLVDGKYNLEKTVERVEEVARGVQHKIEAGVITPVIAEEVK